MAQYINTEKITDNTTDTITYNFDNIKLIEATITTSTLVLTDFPIEYTILKQYTNTLNLKLANNFNLKIIESAAEYLLTDMYICKIKTTPSTGNKSIGIQVKGEIVTSMFLYFVVLQFAPLTQNNQLNNQENVYIIRPFIYSNTQLDVTSTIEIIYSENFLLNVKEQNNDTNTITSIDETNPIIISNINSIDEIVTTTEFFYINSTSKLILFKNPIYLNVKDKNTNLETPKNLIYLKNDTTDTGTITISEYDNYADIEKGTSISKSEIGQTPGTNDASIYINCRKADDAGNILPLVNTPEVESSYLSLTWWITGFYWFSLILYCVLYRKEFITIFNTKNDTESIKIKLKYGSMLFFGIVLFGIIITFYE